MHEFHDLLTECLDQAAQRLKALQELDSAIAEMEARLGRLTWLRQENLRKLREIIRQIAEEFGE